MRKVKWAVDYLDEAKHLVREPEKRKGNWKADPDKKLHVELGAGKGRYALDMAAKYPNEEFIAVEKNESAAGIAAKKYDMTAGLENLNLIHDDAAKIEEWFAPGEVDIIHLNFSDPWPKKRNAKRRLSSSSFLESYRKILAEDGRIEMKTDNQSLFEYSVAEFSKNGYLIDELSVDYRRNEHNEDAITEYEQKFIDLGQPIYRVVLVKDGNYGRN